MTVLVPWLNVVPLASSLPLAMVAPVELQVMDWIPQLSFVASKARPRTTALQAPGSVLVITGAGHVRVGFSLSLIVMVKVQLLLLPQASVAVLVTVVVPFSNAKP